MAKRETVLSVLKEIRGYGSYRPRELRPLEVAVGSRFVKNDDETVTDLVTGLMWGSTLAKEMTWEAATKACKELRLGDHKDWRLPTIKELISLVNYEKRNPAIDTKFFPDTKSDSYWSATTYADSPVYAWFVYFLDGHVNLDYKDYGSYYVRPVRSSQ